MIETGASSDPAVEQRLDNLLNQMYGFYHSEIDMSLDRVTRFLAQLGDPHLHLPPVVHVAGTNGKGSVIATLRSAFETAGFTVHCATSPHLVHPTERIRVAGKLIKSEALVALLEECLAVNRADEITFFEMFMAASFLAFSRAPADYLLLETGMGGRLDATNVVNPVCTIISMISRDHEAFLGNTLPAIASEKAGIMKPGAPCVIGYQTEEAIEAGVLKVFHDYSQALSPPVKLVQAGADWCTGNESTRFRYTSRNSTIHLSHPNLLGPHQIHNVGTALAAFEILEPDHFRGNILSTALSRIDWPARLQRIEIGDLPPEWEVILDGGHNDSGGMTLAKQAGIWEKSDMRPLHLLVAMVNRKDPAAFLSPLVPHAASLTVTQIPNEPSSFTAPELYDRAKGLGFKTLYQANTLDDALAALKQAHGSSPARILICGSLYFAGSVLKEKAAC
jgi:dihydrofolate synthase/folylpolyglutamate synthase